MKNNLDSEKSPYLLQHKDNPIWWQAWGNDAFALAQKEDKPIFLSIGYSACHWCHVMEGDSFTKDDVAELLNRAFISIKVDREEHPEVDRIYMSAVQAMTQSGGWPLTAILTPDGKPFFGGTFIPRQQLKQLLQNVQELWHSPQRAQLLETGEQLANYLRDNGPLAAKPSNELSTEALQTFYQQSLDRFDPQYGGFGRAPKFPPAMALLALMRFYRRSGEKQALAMVQTTLDQMARGGLFDQLGGGFHRYATDTHWLVPHFEKMLYDNALLAWAYTEAFQLTQKQEYALIVRRTLDYALQDLRDSEGAFYAAEDADSEKAEGKFYVWSYEELQALLNPEEFALIVRLYGCSPQGNFASHAHSAIEKAAGLQSVERANILVLGREEALPDFEAPLLRGALTKLLAARAQRERPGLDYKVLSAWNGLMIGSLAKAARVFGEERYLQAASEALAFIERKLLKPDGELLRRFANGEAGCAAVLEDYACVIFACIELYQSSFRAKWLDLAQKLQQTQDRLFANATNPLYFDSDGRDPNLIARGHDLFDNAVPSGNAMAAYNLCRLASLLANEGYREKATAMLAALSEPLAKHPSAFPFLLLSLDFLTDQYKEVSVVGASESQASETARALQRPFIPNMVLAAGPTTENRVPMLRGKNPGIHICQNRFCRPPVHEAEKALAFLEKVTSLSR